MSEELLDESEINDEERMERITKPLIVYHNLINPLEIEYGTPDLASALNDAWENNFWELPYGIPKKIGIGPTEDPSKFLVTVTSNTIEWLNPETGHYQKSNYSYDMLMAILLYVLHGEKHFK
jgi:hypothetical protein